MDCKGEPYFIMDSEEEHLSTMDCKEEIHVTLNCKEPYVIRHCKEENEEMSYIYEDIPQETIMENEEKFTNLGVTQPPSPIVHEANEADMNEETGWENTGCTASEDKNDKEWQPDDSNSSSEVDDPSADEDWEPEQIVRRKRPVNKSKKKSVTSTLKDIVESHSEKSTETKFECPGCPYAFSTELFLKRHEKYCRHHQMDSRLVKEENDCESEGSEVDEPHPTEIDKPATFSAEAGDALRKNSTYEAGTDIRICISEANDGSEAIYKCETCSEWLFNEKTFKIHRKTHSATEDDTLYYYCPKCERPFVRKYHLANHIRIKHHDGTPHKCDRCDKTFGRKTDLRMHLRTHVDNGFTTCEFCDKKFLMEERYKKHLAKHQKGLFVCPKCGQEFVRKPTFHTHIKMHEEGQLTCTECNKKFAQKRHLTTHMRSHSGEQPYECKECGKKFSLRENYMRHLRSHTGDKPFACGKCGKRFAVKGNLRNHEWTHSDKKPHVCDICSKQFAEKNSLTRHLRTHSGEKPYLCSLCDKRFSRKHHVKLHLQQHLKKDGEVVFIDCEDEVDVTSN